VVAKFHEAWMGTFLSAMDLSPTARMRVRTPMYESDDEIARSSIDDLMKDPEVSEEYVASRLDRALESWPGAIAKRA
jgi:hypothetical protein